MTPPGLLGAALVFWGWQTGFVAVGAVMAMVLEARHVVRWRWDLSRADFNRVSDLSAVLLVVIAAYQILGNESARAITALFQWLPLTVFPLAFCQVFSVAGTVDASIFFWSLRRRADAEPSRPGMPVDLTYPYAALAALSASAANVRTASFYIGLCALTAWALWRSRSRRYPGASWAAAMVAAVALGYAGHVGLAQMQRALERRASQWLMDYIRRDTDPYRSTTALGQIGTLKLSDRIVLRVDAGARPPVLLREAAYNVYSSPVWYATDAGFTPVRSEGDGASWTLGGKTPARESVTISAYLRRGKGMLAMPAGTARLDGLVVADLSRNRLGAVKVEEGLALVRYDARFTPAAPIDGPPTPADLALPPREAKAVTSVAADLQLRAREPAQALDVVRAYFLGRFRYSRFLPGTAVGASPLEDFLLRTHAGHCEYFATATVHLLRAAGIPARYAVGYAVHEWSRLERRYLVRAHDAHAWALAWIDGAWREIDTTPPEWIAIEAGDDSALRPLDDLWSWAGFAFSRWRYGERDDRLTTSVGWLLIPLIALLAWRLYFRRRVRAAMPAPAAPASAARGADSEFYLVATRLDALAFARGPGEPLSVWLERLEAARVPGVSTAGLSPMLALHYRHRFDPDGLPAAERARLATSARRWLTEHGE